MNPSNQNNLAAPSLFAQNQASQPSQNLFGGIGNQQQKPIQQTSLFGSSQMGTSPGGLFGQLNQNQTQTTSIFGSNY